jgi:hypothetical protein
MLLIKTNQENVLVVTVSQNATIPNPEWLFSFTHIFSKQNVSFIPTNVSTSKVRYDEFLVYEGSGAGKVQFPYEGLYVYNIYQQPQGSGNLNPQYSSGLIETGQAQVIVQSANTTNDYYIEYVSNNEYNSNFIFAPDELTPSSTVSVYSQVVSFSSTPMNSIVYRCDGNFAAASYGTNQTNLTDLISMFNSVPPVQSQATFLDYGISYDNGDGRVRMEMDVSVYNSLCSGGTLTLDVIYD